MWYVVKFGDLKKKKKHLQQFILICIHNFCDFKSFHCTKIHTIFGDLKLWRLSSKRSPHQSNMLYNNSYIINVCMQ